MNTFIGFGHISKAAQTRTVDIKGKPTMVTDFTVAVNDGYGDHEKTDFFRCSVWRNAGANLKQYLTLGRPVIIRGAVTARPWLMQDGKPAAQLEIRHPEIELIGKNPNGKDDVIPLDAATTEPNEYIDEETGEVITADELPFGE